MSKVLDLDFLVKDKKYMCLVAEMLNELMEKHKINRQQLADYTGVPYTTLQGWDLEAEPKVQGNLMKVAQFFKVPLEYFCYGIGMDEEGYDVMITEKDKRIKELEMKNYFLEAERKNQQTMSFMGSADEVSSQTVA